MLVYAVSALLMSASNSQKPPKIDCLMYATFSSRSLVAAPVAGTPVASPNPYLATLVSQSSMPASELTMSSYGVRGPSPIVAASQRTGSMPSETDAVDGWRKRARNSTGIVERSSSFQVIATSPLEVSTDVAAMPGSIEAVWMLRCMVIGWNVASSCAWSRSQIQGYVVVVPSSHVTVSALG